MSKKNGFISEFKEFILRGNVMDMAVGVIVGGAFTAIVTAFTDDFITPLISIFGGTEFGGKIPLPGPEGNAILWGDFVSAVVNFLIVALILFLMLKGMNKMISLRKKEEEAAEEAAEPSAEEALLTEIRDLLKEKN